jgi:hypothetical protein
MDGPLLIGRRKSSIIEVTTRGGLLISSDLDVDALASALLKFGEAFVRTLFLSEVRHRVFPSAIALLTRRSIVKVNFELLFVFTLQGATGGDTHVCLSPNRILVALIVGLPVDKGMFWGLTLRGAVTCRAESLASCHRRFAIAGGRTKAYMRRALVDFWTVSGRDCELRPIAAGGTVAVAAGGGDEQQTCEQIEWVFHDR